MNASRFISGPGRVLARIEYVQVAPDAKHVEQARRRPLHYKYHDRGQQKLPGQDGQRQRMATYEESSTMVFRCRKASQARDLFGGLLFVFDESDLRLLSSLDGSFGRM